MLTKNGTSPLDIDTTVEIEKLPTDHIKSNQPSKSSFFLTPEDIATPPDGIFPNKLKDDKLKAKELPKIDKCCVQSSGLEKVL